MLKTYKASNSANCAQVKILIPEEIGAAAFEGIFLSWPLKNKLFSLSSFYECRFPYSGAFEKGAWRLESSLLNKKRDVFQWQTAAMNTQPQCITSSLQQQRECEEQNLKGLNWKVPLFVLQWDSTYKASSTCTLSKGQWVTKQKQLKPLPIKVSLSFSPDPFTFYFSHLIKCGFKNKREFQSALFFAQLMECFGLVNLGKSISEISLEKIVIKKLVKLGGNSKFLSQLVCECNMLQFNL